MKELLQRYSKVLGLVVALAAVSAVIVVWRSRDRSGPSGEHHLPTVDEVRSGNLPYKSYYFEARVTWGSTKQGRDADALLMRGWYEAPGRTRWDVAPAETGFDGPVRTLIQTEKEFIYFEPTRNAYMRQPIPAGQTQNYPTPFMSNIAIGPLISYLNEGDARFVRTESVLRREAELWEADAGNDSSSSSCSSKATCTTSTSHSVAGMRFWVDAKRQFVLRQVRESNDQVGSFIAEITKLEFDRPIEASSFTMEAPTGARRVPQSMVFEQPFLSPTYIPEVPTMGNGISSGGGSIGGNHKTEERSLTLSNGKLSIRQETSPDGLLPAGTPSNVGGLSAVRSSSGSQNTVTWDVLNLRIEVSGPLPFEEIQKIAESMQ